MAVRPGTHIRNPRRGNVSQSVLSALNFTPLHLNPQLWLDASDDSTITLSGSSVSQWNDKSGNGRNVAQGTAAYQPATSTRNGKTVIDFDGSNDWLERVTDTSLGQNVTGLTVYAVYNPNVLTSTIFRTVVRIEIESPSTLARVLLANGFVANQLSAGGRTLDADSFQRVDSSNKTANQWYLHTAVFDYANTDLFQYVNNIADGSSTSFQTATTTSNTASNNLKIGGFDFASNQFDGQVGEVIVYHQAHDWNTMQIVNTYLANKWGPF